MIKTRKELKEMSTSALIEFAYSAQHDLYQEQRLFRETMITAYKQMTTRVLMSRLSADELVGIMHFLVLVDEAREKNTRGKILKEKWGLGYWYIPEIGYYREG